MEGKYPQMPLKHPEIQGFRAKDALYKKADEKGLSLWVFPQWIKEMELQISLWRQRKVDGAGGIS
jgi:hypothetical protein